MADAMLVHLQLLVERAGTSAFVLGGGLGLRVKREHLLSHRAVTLAGAAGYEVPEARATFDIDLFLGLELFVDASRGAALRAALLDLGYEVVTGNWQFEKRLSTAAPEHIIAVDLLARPPNEAERANVKVRGIRVGAGSAAKLHGRRTDEAFAVDASPQMVDIRLGGATTCAVRVPHPYAWLNLKLRAAHDWLKYSEQPWPLGEGQKPPSPKHAFDAALVVAMATEAEVAEAAEQAERWRGHEPATAIVSEALVLFGSRDAAGWRAARRQGMFDDHALIWDTMRTMLGAH